jgi:hypothetical protein
MDGTTAFHLWSELLAEMQGEVAERLDPFSKQALAMTSTQLWARFGQRLSMSPFNVAAYAAPKYAQNVWKRGFGSLHERDPNHIYAFGSTVARWFEGLSRRGDVNLFVTYLDLAMEISQERPSLFISFVHRAVYTSNNIAFVTRTAERYPPPEGLTLSMVVEGILSAQELEPNIDLLIMVGDNDDTRSFFYGCLQLACRPKHGRVLAECAKRLPELGAKIVADCTRCCIADPHYRLVGTGLVINKNVVAKLRFWVDLRPVYTFSESARAWMKAPLESVLINELVSPSKDASIYRDLRAPLQELFPELVHFTDWAFKDTNKNT